MSFSLGNLIERSYKMRSKSLIISVLLFSLITSFLIFSGCGGKSDEKVNVGVIIPLTGQASSYGNQMKNGVTLWQKNHPEAKIKLFIEDGQADAKRSLTIFSSLNNQHSIKALVTGFSGVVLSLAPLANKNEIVLINGGATNPAIKRSGEYIFNVIPDAEIEAKFIANFLIDTLSINKCFIYWQNNDAGKGMRDYFIEDFRKRGGEIIGDISHNVNQTDFKNDLIKIRNSRTKFVFIPTYAKDFGLILRQAASLGMENIIWVGYAASETKDLIDLVKGIANGKVIYSYYQFDPQLFNSENTKKFLESYKKEFNDIPGLYSSTFYDAITLINYAVEQKNYTGKQIKDFLYNINTFEGVSGTLLFNGKNYITSGLRMKMIYDNKFTDFKLNKLNNYR